MTGIPAYAGAAIPAVTPGTTSNATRGGERLRLFAAATEHERIAALESHDALPLARETHEQRVDLVLPRRLARAAAFADVVQLDRASRVVHRREREQRRIGQRVVDDRVADHEQLAAAQREQPGIARARADEIDDSVVILASVAQRLTSLRERDTAQAKRCTPTYTTVTHT